MNPRLPARTPLRAAAFAPLAAQAEADRVGMPLRADGCDGARRPSGGGEWKARSGSVAQARAGWSGGGPPALPPRWTRPSPLVGLAVSLGVHALLFTLASRLPVTPPGPPAAPAEGPTVVWLSIPPVQPDAPPERRVPEAAAPVRDRAAEPAAPAWVPQEAIVAPAAGPRQPVSMAAPPAPTAEEWAFAGRYALKNSKAYRYTWGQQVRSMMGTAVEGPDQGVVRFRVEVAPDGHLARLETLWTTSPVAERLARQAVETMPRWPPTPTGQPLIFERTISFTPFATDGPPLYRDDCLPDPPVFRNPFVWDGRSDREPAPPPPIENADPQALEDCLKQLPRDSIEAESAHDRRVMEQWGSSTSGR